jgi:hypothetical protein
VNKFGGLLALADWGGLMIKAAETEEDSESEPFGSILYRVLRNRVSQQYSNMIAGRGSFFHKWAEHDIVVTVGHESNGRVFVSLIWEKPGAIEAVDNV